MGRWCTWMRYLIWVSKYYVLDGWKRLSKFGRSTLTGSGFPDVYESPCMGKLVLIVTLGLASSSLVSARLSVSIPFLKVYTLALDMFEHISWLALCNSALTTWSSRVSSPFPNTPLIKLPCISSLLHNPGNSDLALSWSTSPAYIPCRTADARLFARLLLKRLVRNEPTDSSSISAGLRRRKGSPIIPLNTPFITGNLKDRMTEAMSPGSWLRRSG